MRKNSIEMEGKMENKTEAVKIVSAGHICLDITPVFMENGGAGNDAEGIGELLVPGRLLQMGPADVHIGGSVANTGLALKILGADVTLMAKTGTDAFGQLVQTQIKQYGARQKLSQSGQDATSYSVVIAPKGIDRIFLHHSGANDTFCCEDIDFDTVKEADLFHFGYPPLMKNMYDRDGEELLRILKRVKELDTAVSMDMAMVDEKAESGAADWESILGKTIPYVDFFVPSIEELAIMIDKPRYREWQKRARGRDITTVLNIEKDVRPLAEKMLSMGAKVLLVKCGAAGLYLASADARALSQAASGYADKLKGWENIRYFEAGYRPEKVLSGTGAGDTCIAAFLLAVSQGYSYQECMRLSAATGASCVEAYDALSGLKSFRELQEKIQKGWEKNKPF